MPGTGPTRIQDVIQPEIFVPYLINRTAELSAFVQSGIITRNTALDQLVTGGGTTLQMPFWQDLTGESQVMDDVNPIEADKITSSKDIATMLIRTHAWSSHELAGALAGDDPQAAIIQLVANWWVRDEQRILFKILDGIFISSSMQDLILPAPTTPIAGTSGSLVLEAKQLLGDAAGQLTAIGMHSMTYTFLQQKGLIEFVPSVSTDTVPTATIQIPTYLGYRVIVDDGMPVTGSGASAIYTSYLFAAGTIARGEGVPVSLTPVATDRDEPMSTDYLFHRRAFVLHPMGIKWIGTPAAPRPTPNNAELATGTNWERVVEKKQIGIVQFTHSLAA